jgi:asparagine synthase (glutamine-hydrolysing)
MCGIVGLWELRESANASQPLEVCAREMAARLAHRGPDDAGTWHDPTAGIAFGHRRLSVLDLSHEGRQPMHSSTGRLVMVFNGEIYNHRELRSELEKAGQSFRGTSDTEVALAAILQWGLDEAVARFNGMFALAVWDRKEQCLSLARDRLGIKPLYFGWIGTRFVFSSELKALTCLTDFTRDVDREALASFFHYGCVSAPQCIYKGIETLQPATLLHLSRAECARREPRTRRYWSVEPTLRRRRQIATEDAETELEDLLRDSVRLRMVADVPVGAFLSGGIDSSLVVALMQAQSARPIRTFTIGFHEDQYDEAPYAAAVARHLGTDHTELYVSADEAMEVIPSISEIWDEPFADSSQIPTFLVSKLAAGEVTVALSGDGGDELFGGYTRYAAIAREWRRSQRLPLPLRRTAGRAATWMADPARELLLRPLLPVLRCMGKSTDNLQQQILWRAHAWSQADLVDFYIGHAAFAINPRVGGFLTDVPGLGQVVSKRHADTAIEDPIERMMLLDLHQYLPDDILTKVDRASMAVSLEARVPILDHRVVELAWKLPFESKVREGIGKVVLREVLGRHLPEGLFDRPKMGFGIPFGEWMRGPLRGWAEDLLAPSRLAESGFFDISWIRDRWHEHVAQTNDHRNLFWPILMFEAWRRHWKAS